MDDLKYKPVLNTPESDDYAFVSMIQFGGRLFAATGKGIYEMVGGHWERMKIYEEIQP